MTQPATVHTAPSSTPGAPSDLASLFAGQPAPRPLSAIHNDLRVVRTTAASTPGLLARIDAEFAKHARAATEASEAETLLNVIRSMLPAAPNLTLTPPTPAAEQPAAPPPTGSALHAGSDGTGQPEVTDGPDHDQEAGPETDEDLTDQESDVDANQDGDQDANQDGDQDANQDEDLAGDEPDGGQDEPGTASEPEPDQDTSRATAAQESQPAAAPAAGGSDPAPPAPAPVYRPVPAKWPAGALGTGFLSELAASLAAGESALLSLARRGGELLVVIQPKAVSGESGTDLHMSAQDTPARLDETFTQQLRELCEAREVARGTASYLEQVKKHAEAVRSAATKKTNPATTSSTNATTTGSTTSKSVAKPVRAPATGTLEIQISPKGAVCTLSDDRGVTHPFEAFKTLTLPVGSYTLTAESEGFEPQKVTLAVKAGKLNKQGVVLSRRVEGGLF